MTYGLGIPFPGGLVMASDSRSDAGIDQVGLVCGPSVFEPPRQRVVVLLSPGHRAEGMPAPPAWG